MTGPTHDIVAHAATNKSLSQTAAETDEFCTEFYCSCTIRKLQLTAIIYLIDDAQYIRSFQMVNVHRSTYTREHLPVFEHRQFRIMS